MTDDIHSLAARIDALEEIIANANADKAVVYQDAKKALREDLPAFREAMAQRRKRDRNPAAYEALKGRAGELLEALDNGVVLEHARTRAPARAAKSEAGASTRKGEGETGTTPKVAAGHKGRDPASDTPTPPALSPAACGPDPGNPAGTNATASPREDRDSADGKPDDGDGGIDAGWQAKDGEGNYLLALQVANGRLPHPADVSHIVPMRPDRTAIDDPAGPLPQFLRAGSDARAAITGRR